MVRLHPGSLRMVCRCFGSTPPSVRRKTRFNSGTDLLIEWAAGPTGRHLVCTQVIGVRFPGGPLEKEIDYGRQPDTVGRAGLLNRAPRKGHVGSNPMPSACSHPRHGDEGLAEGASMVKRNHASLLTRCSGFESWSRC